MIVISMIPNNTRERILLNLLRLKEGGGRQNALSFVTALGNDKENKSRCVALVTHGTPLHEACNSTDLKTIVVPDTSAYLLYECFYGQQLLKGQVCFAIFGFPLPMSVGRAVNVCGCGLSNLFYPEIDFWKYLPRLKYQHKQLKDCYRRTRVAHADFWIFETEAVQRRAIELCNFPEDRVSVVPMAPSRLVSPENIDEETKCRFDKQLRQVFRILFLNEARPNKRMHVLPALAEHLWARGQRDFCFVTTMDNRHQYARRVLDDFSERGLGHFICNIGPVSAGDVASLISCTDMMCTFSVLESFSNNFVEAWKMRKPLVVTDADWARCSCGAGACYVSPEESGPTAEILDGLIRSQSTRNDYVQRGQEQLSKYPTHDEKNAKYFECIERARSLGTCPRAVRRAIKWPSVVL